VTNTLLRAAPQLGHLLIVLLACILLFACVACVGLGERVSYLNSAGAAIEETFSVLLGLGSVTLADVFPGSAGMSAAEALLGLLIYYLRVVLFVMITVLHGYAWCRVLVPQVAG
jgi:predicted small secreted protein